MKTKLHLLIHAWAAGTITMLLCAGAGAQVNKSIGHPEFAKISGNLVVKSAPQVTNPAVMNSPTLNLLQQQKQAADLESGQIMSASGGGAGPVGALGASSAGGRNAGPLMVKPAPPSPPKPGVAMQTAPGTMCMAGVTGIRAVNQKKTGVIFTPDPRYDLYTIVGCGFGNSPGKIYLQGGSGAFPAHGGKLTLMPVDPVRGWSDRAIIAKLDPSITGELDQDNVSLVVETSTGQRGQAGGFSFYAVRGPAFQLKQIPETAATTNVGYQGSPIATLDGLFASPCHGLWSSVNVLTDCTVELYRAGPRLDLRLTTVGSIVDTFAPKLKPGFIISAAQVQLSTLKENQGDVLNPYMLKFTGNQISITEQPALIDASAPGHYFVFYGIKLFVSGPAGISNPLADGQ